MSETWSRDRLFAIRNLAAFAPRLRTESEAIRPDSGVLKQLIDVARRHGRQAIGEYQRILLRSDAMLSPLGEPLTRLDFVEHRWMAGHREEAFSDWLQWIMLQASALEVLRVFGVDDSEMISRCAGCDVRIEREQCVLYGHEGSAGRLDLEIRLGDAATLVIEVKLGGAEGADTEKGHGYCKSGGNERGKKYVLLALDAAEKDYDGFTPRLWAEVCIELRRMAARSCKQDQLLRAAMNLAFVSAVEQNLLKFRPRVLGDNTVTAALDLPRITDHLNRFLENSHLAEEHRF